MIPRLLFVLVVLDVMPAAAQLPPGEPPAPPESPELPPPPPATETRPPAEGEEISLEDWNRDDWMLVQPKLSLLKLGGYFRARGLALRKLDFDQNHETPNW